MSISSAGTEQVPLVGCKYFRLEMKMLSGLNLGFTFLVKLGSGVADVTELVWKAECILVLLGLNFYII